MRTFADGPALSLHDVAASYGRDPVLEGVTGCTLNTYGAGAPPALRRPSSTRKYVPGCDSVSVSTSVPTEVLKSRLPNGSTSRQVALPIPVVTSK